MDSDKPPPLAAGRLPPVHASDFNHYLRTTAVVYQRFVDSKAASHAADASERRVSIAEFASGEIQPVLWSWVGGKGENVGR